MADLRRQFIEAAVWHGTLDEAERILAGQPELGALDVHTAAITGDDDAVRRFLAADPASAHAKSPPYGGDALNYLGLSKYLRLDKSRTPAFARAATALLDAGADPNTGFWLNGERETALYGACGVAHNPVLTRLLVERGADPRDPEVVYHGPETHELDALRVIVETGRLTPDDLAMMLIRKIDWHHQEGVAYLLANGAAPSRVRGRGWTALHHALARANDTPIIRMLLDHGADPLGVDDGLTAVQRAVRHGRRDVLDELERRAVPLDVAGVDRLLMAVARGPDDAAIAAAGADPVARHEILARGGEYLAKFCGAWNWDGMRRLLDLGVPVNAPWAEGDGYFGIPAGVLPIHVASWLVLPEAIRLLVARGADVNAATPDTSATPLMLYARGCTESYWTELRNLDGARVLLDAGAATAGVRLPTGYDELDALLRARGAGAGA